MSTPQSSQCAIIVPSCDAYSDVWPAFFHFFFKYWPDCPYPVYLVSESKTYPDPRVKNITLGKDFGWANNMKVALEKINSPYFIYFLEDALLIKKVDTARVQKFLAITVRDRVACLRLHPSPGPGARYKEKDLGVISQDAPYRVSTMTAIWNTESFLKLLKPGENAWQMELEGTKRAWGIPELFLSVYPKDRAVDYILAVKRGMWHYDMVRMCERDGVVIDRSRRRVEPLTEYLWRRVGALPGLGPVHRRLAPLVKSYARRQKP